MIVDGRRICPICGGDVKYYDRVTRTVRTKNGQKFYSSLERVRCTQCNRLHRVVPNYILPYIQYDKEIVAGVLEGLITSDTLGFENYPCERTMERWKHTQKLQVLL